MAYVGILSSDLQSPSRLFANCHHNGRLPGICLTGLVKEPGLERMDSHLLDMSVHELMEGANISGRKKNCTVKKPLRGSPMTTAAEL